jgi:hypothetical protein
MADSAVSGTSHQTHNDLFRILTSTLDSILPRVLLEIIDGYSSLSRIYVITTASTIWTYSLDHQSWSLPLQAPSTTASHLSKGQGGSDSAHSSSSLTYRDPARNKQNNLIEGRLLTWTYNDHLYLHSRVHNDPRITHAHKRHGITLLPSPPIILQSSRLGSVTVRVNHHLYIIGGKYSKQCCYFDIIKSSWHLCAPMKAHLQHQHAIIMVLSLVCFGGIMSYTLIYLMPSICSIVLLSGMQCACLSIHLNSIWWFTNSSKR